MRACAAPRRSPARVVAELHAVTAVSAADRLERGHHLIAL